MQIIGFCGSQATGKTSLINKLQEKHHDKIIKCIEGAREVAKEIGIESVNKINPRQRYTFQRKILERHLDTISKMSMLKEGVLLCDRTIFDIYTYSILSHQNIPLTFFERMKHVIEDNLYSTIYYFPIIDLPKKDMKDGFRETRTREHVGIIMQGVLSRFKVDHIVVPKCNLKERIEWFEREFNLL